MPLPNYEYDIFISYRQNDNRSSTQGPGWVAEFVRSLREELAATIKRPVSVYADFNPRDGLLESHSVDKSLEGKLKSLIFIPILSQTYCDPNSFAWQHEFVAFNRMASQDAIGRDVKLSNGNVASRILPVKIHELDADDVGVIETELQNPLRAIDFTFRSAGVNRPLLPRDDETPGEHQISYRNQINKTANAIKELLTAMKAVGASQGAAPLSPQPLTVRPRSKKIVSIVTAAVLLVSVAAYVVFYFSNPAGAIERDAPAIAVLPFVDMSPGRDQTYLGDGLAEAVINSLVTVKDLKVIGRTSSFQFRDEKIDLRQIGEILGVNCILEGSVQKMDGRIRITAQLIDVKDNSHLWSKQYDHKLDDIFRIQDDIASNIINSLKGTLLGVDPVDIGTSNALAYETYLKGEFQLTSYTKEGTHNAIKLFEEAIHLDSTFAEAYVRYGIAQTYRASIFVAEISGPESEALAMPYYLKGLELNPRSALAHLHMGFKHLYDDWDHNAADKEYSLAIEHGINQPDVLSIYADYLNFVGRHEEALKYAKLQVEREPYFPNSRVPFALFFLGREEEALDFQRDRLKIMTSYWNHDIWGFLNLNTGNYAEAIKSFKAATELLGERMPRMIGWMGAAYAKSGDRKQAELLLAELGDMAKKSNAGSPNFFMAVIFTALGNNNAALTALERAVEVHDWEMPWIATEPQLYPLHSEPRFIEVARTVGFSDFGR
jgi:TolB-like protein